MIGSMKYRVLCKQIHMLLLYWSMNCALVLGTGTVYCVMGTRHWHWVLLLQYCIYALCPGFGVLCYWLYWVLCYSKRVIRHCLSSLHYTLSALQMEYSLSSTHERLSVTHSIIANPLSTSKLFIIKPCQSWWRRMYPVSPNTSIGSQLRSFTKNSCCWIFFEK